MHAFIFHFPRIKCCFFHLGQGFYRKLCTEGLKEQYKHDADFKMWVKKVISLALIPVEKVEDFFKQLCTNKSDYIDKIDNFLDYVLLNYIRTMIAIDMFFLLKYGTITKLRNVQTIILKATT